MPSVGVGVSAVVTRDHTVLLGLRRGAHGAGTWAFPGGRVEFGEDPASAAVRELREETGLMAEGSTPICWTSDVFEQEDLHFVTLHYWVSAPGQPVVNEPEKAAEWRWAPWDDLPNPLFTSAQALRDTGWHP